MSSTSMRLRTFLPTFLCVCLMVGATPATSALADPTPDQLAALRAQEQSQKAALSRLAGQRQSARAALDQLRAALNSKRADYQNQPARADQLSQQIAALDARGKEIQKQHDAHIGLFRIQSRSLYKTGPADAIVFLFEANSFSDFLDRLVYVAHVTRDNYDQAVRLRDERDALARDREQTARLKAELDPLLAELAARATAAAGQVPNQAAIESAI